MEIERSKEIIDLADQGKVNEALERLNRITDIGQREATRWMVYQICVTDQRWEFVYLIVRQSYSSNIDNVLKPLRALLKDVPSKGWKAKVKALVNRSLFDE